jgi:hypothetical protein
MPGIRATKVPYRMEQTERFLRSGLPAGSSISAKWMKTLFGLPRLGSVQGRLQSDSLAGNWTALRPLTRFASAFQVNIPLHPDLRAEYGICSSARRSAHVPSSASEPKEHESFQPSMLCNRSLPIYLQSDDRAVPPTSNGQMRGLTTCP